jgi:hypothetical protein
MANNLKTFCYFCTIMILVFIINLKKQIQDEKEFNDSVCCRVDAILRGL